METPAALPQTEVRPASAGAEPSALARMAYLCPSRYLRCYMLHERGARRTCWLPEGYDA